MAQGGKLPVQHGSDLGVLRMDDQIAQPEVAVHDAGGLLQAGRERLQPLPKHLHAIRLPSEAILLRGFHDNLVLSPVVSGPSLNLAGGIVAGLAIVLEAQLFVVQRVQRRQNPVHIPEQRRALLCSKSGQAGTRIFQVVEDPPRNVLHNIKVLPQDRGILAHRKHLGHRHPCASECLLHPVLAVHLMCPRQQIPRWFLSNDEFFASGGLDEVRRIRGAVVKLFQLQPAAAEALRAVFDGLLEVGL
mmetsp:Transcript_71836/g.233458  ORF Transcript_71836/g.233458 Transcript_71836/m.233458 type:complete len:245 (+) Transcript_71836:412-1146(+)